MNTNLATTFKTALTFCVVTALKLKSTSHFLLDCHHYTNIRLTLVNSIAKIVGNAFNITDECLVFCIRKYTEIDNSHIVNATIKYFLDAGRFNGPLL